MFSFEVEKEKGNRENNAIAIPHLLNDDNFDKLRRNFERNLGRV